MGVSVDSQIPLLAGIIENIVEIAAFVILAKPPAWIPVMILDEHCFCSWAWAPAATAKDSPAGSQPGRGLQVPGLRLGEGGSRNVHVQEADVEFDFSSVQQEQSLRSVLP